MIIDDKSLKAMQAMMRMLKAESIPGWQAEPYFYSIQYELDCDTLREFMKDNNIEQKFMMYGDQMIDGKLVKMGEK